MLVITRKPGQVLRIGRHIKIHIGDIQGNQVRVGVTAPYGSKILRGELFEQTDSRQGEAG